MAVKLKDISSLHPVPGIRLGTAMAGLRKPNRRDLVVIECIPETLCAVVFTRNRFCAAPVIVAREHMTLVRPRALLINTGYANAGTGAPGIKDTRITCQQLAKLLGCSPEEILPFSTGVIGERLPMDRLNTGLPVCVQDLNESGWGDAAVGILTTDTKPKASSRMVQLSEAKITITGIAKGAGMIRPNMATMLAFIATDAHLSQSVLDQCLRQAVDASFHRITVDGDTSTNDACVLLATGRARNQEITQARGEDYQTVASAVTEVCMELAQAIVRDGEGATKFITIEVNEGASESDCLEVAYAIGHSPLVKTAFFASDPNWGRILAAIGRAPIAKLEVTAVSIYLNNVCVVRAGALAPDYTEDQGRKAMHEAEIKVRVTLGMGSSAARVWTCDLSHDYVRINAEYRS